MTAAVAIIRTVRPDTGEWVYAYPYGDEVRIRSGSPGGVDAETRRDLHRLHGEPCELHYRDRKFSSLFHLA
jgi:hypothetical protein